MGLLGGRWPLLERRARCRVVGALIAVRWGVLCAMGIRGEGHPKFQDLKAVSMVFEPPKDRCFCYAFEDRFDIMFRILVGECKANGKPD